LVAAHSRLVGFGAGLAAQSHRVHRRPPSPILGCDHRQLWVRGGYLLLAIITLLAASLRSCCAAA